MWDINVQKFLTLLLCLGFSKQRSINEKNDLENANLLNVSQFLLILRMWQVLKFLLLLTGKLSLIRFWEKPERILWLILTWNRRTCLSVAKHPILEDCTKHWGHFWHSLTVIHDLATSLQRSSFNSICGHVFIVPNAEELGLNKHLSYIINII